MGQGQKSPLEEEVVVEVEDQHWRMKALVVEAVEEEDLRSLVMVEAVVLLTMKVEVESVEHSEEVVVARCCFELVEVAEEVQV